eukprot:3635188-Rhodomonas_salina.2
MKLPSLSTPPPSCRLTLFFDSCAAIRARWSSKTDSFSCSPAFVFLLFGVPPACTCPLSPTPTSCVSLPIPLPLASKRSDVLCRRPVRRAEMLLLPSPTPMPAACDDSPWKFISRAGSGMRYVRTGDRTANV